MFNNGAPWPWNNRPPVVVLADKAKVDMDSAVHEMLKYVQTSTSIILGHLLLMTANTASRLHAAGRFASVQLK
jgi:hypothetical protein